MTLSLSALYIYSPTEIVRFNTSTGFLTNSDGREQVRTKIVHRYEWGVRPQRTMRSLYAGGMRPRLPLLAAFRRD
ncbi:hypothetical protein EVAR_64259_1 [Eumeta japonica]|uniref:Uncharacterized protein n=1 Tax=Eumeta variegata TaxID=151549 RepID=A0A4C1YYV6_EUMVA|nr:hypothetical protein EVAR_64259_1 [Eumeta japonica]